MIVRVVAPDQYYETFSKTRNVFGSEAFISTVTDKAQAVRHFIGYDDDMRPRLGIVAGYRDNEWHAPFSAPFCEIAYNEPQQLERIYDFISELTEYLGTPLHITLPPTFYDPEMLTRLTGVLGNYARKVTLDYDFYFDTSDFDKYTETLDHSSRKNLNRALKSHLTFAKTSDLDRAYTVIKANREAHNYNLAMSIDRLRNTTSIIEADYFILSDNESDIAAAIVYHVAQGIVQVIYWGDIPGFSALRPMNLLAYKVLEHYYRQGIKTVDIGPSSANGIPNSGLCRFKHSIGCRTAIKPSFVF